MKHKKLIFFCLLACLCVLIALVSGRCYSPNYSRTGGRSSTCTSSRFCPHPPALVAEVLFWLLRGDFQSSDEWGGEFLSAPHSLQRIFFLSPRRVVALKSLALGEWGDVWDWNESIHTIVASMVVVHGWTMWPITVRGANDVILSRLIKSAKY